MDSPTIDNRPPLVIEHRSSTSIIGNHVLDMLADDPHMQPNVNMAGPIDPSSPRRVEQFIARAEQRLELAHGGTCDIFSARYVNMVPTRHFGAIALFSALRRLCVQPASNKPRARNEWLMCNHIGVMWRWRRPNIRASSPRGAVARPRDNIRTADNRIKHAMVCRWPARPPGHFARPYDCLPARPIARPNTAFLTRPT